MKSLAPVFILLFAITLHSCDYYLEEEIPNDPISNFEQLWTEFDEYYSLFEYKNVDWDSVYNVTRPYINASTSNDELWDRCTAMLDVLDDSHTFIVDFEGEHFFLSGDSTRKHAEDEFSINVVTNTYLTELRTAKDTVIKYGSLQNTNIGYVYLGNMQGDFPEDFRTIVDYFKNTDALVVDIRNNGGGADEYSHEVASYLSDGEHFIYTVQTKNGPDHTDFDAPTKWYTQQAGGFVYTKPIALLTDRQTISGGEIFCMNMKAFAHVTQIGDNTCGAQSDLSPIRTLPNGWQYGFSYQKYLDPNGINYETVGIAPDIYVYNTKEDIEQGNDKVLAYAIEYLNQ